MLYRPCGWLGLTILVAVGGCSSNDTKPIADSSQAVEGLPIEGPHTWRPEDSSGQRDGGAPKEAGGQLLPGCSTPCNAGEVCDDGACKLPGPTKTCGSSPYSISGANVIYVGPPPSGGGPNYSTIKDALASAKAGDRIAVAAGTYADSLSIDKSVELHCACPSAVAISGTVTINAASLSSLKVTIDGCRISPTALAAPTSWGTCTSTVSDDPVGIKVQGTGPVDLLIRDSEIAGWCTGLFFAPSELSAPTLCVARSRFTANAKALDIGTAPNSGLQVAAECQGALSTTLPVVARLNHVDQNQNYGILTRTNALTIGVRANLVELSGTIAGTKGGKGYGAFFGDSDGAVADSNVFRNNENVGMGLRNTTGHAAAQIKISNNVFAANGGAGIALQRLQAAKPVEISGNQVTGTRQLDSNLAKALSCVRGGDGIQASIDGDAAYQLLLSKNTISGSARNGILLDGIGGSMTENTISGSGNYGVLAQQNSTAQASSNTFSGNATGDVKTSPAVIDTHADLPLPLP